MIQGTTVKYDPAIGTDIITWNGVSTNTRTRFQFITGMKEYETKSLEELRFEDYMANRKGPGKSSALNDSKVRTRPNTQRFSSSKPEPGSTSLFGKSLDTGFGKSATGSLFGTSSISFGQPVSVSAKDFTFGGSSQFPFTSNSCVGSSSQILPAAGSTLGSSSQNPPAVGSSLQTTSATGFNSSSQAPTATFFKFVSSLKTPSATEINFSSRATPKNSANPFFNTEGLFGTQSKSFERSEEANKEASFSSGQSTTSTLTSPFSKGTTKSSTLSSVQSSDLLSSQNKGLISKQPPDVNSSSSTGILLSDTQPIQSKPGLFSELRMPSSTENDLTKKESGIEEEKLSAAIVAKVANLTDEKFRKLEEKLTENLNYSTEKNHDVFMSRIETLLEEQFKKLEEKCYQQVSSVLTSKLEKLFEVNFRKLVVRHFSKPNRVTQQHLEASVTKLDAVVTKLDVSRNDKCKTLDENPQENYNLVSTKLPESPVPKLEEDNTRKQGDCHPLDTEHLCHKISDDVISKLETLFDDNFRTLNERFLAEQDRIAKLLSKIETELEMKMSTQENTSAHQTSGTSLDDLSSRLSRLEVLLTEKDKNIGELKN